MFVKVKFLKLTLVTLLVAGCSVAKYQTEEEAYYSTEVPKQYRREVAHFRNCIEDAEFDKGLLESIKEKASEWVMLEYVVAPCREIKILLFSKEGEQVTVHQLNRDQVAKYGVPPYDFNRIYAHPAFEGGVEYDFSLAPLLGITEYSFISRSGFPAIDRLTIVNPGLNLGLPVAGHGDEYEEISDLVKIMFELGRTGPDRLAPHPYE